jgi:site-specific DNA-adenine methylase
MGSKRSSAGKIYQAIKNIHPESKILVDLFCGGFAISEYFYKQGWQIIANDANQWVIALLQKVIFEGLDEKKVTEFVTREIFQDVKEYPDKYEDWFVGFAQCCYSFGNNQADYLFGKDVEPYKKAGHELVINKNPELIKQLIKNIPQNYIDGILKQSDWHKRRIALNMVTRKLKTRIFELERLERLEQLQLYSGDYRDVKIPEGAIIYCDPPYQGTATYKEDGFNHDEFLEWARDKSKTHPVYISEYNAPEDFKKILEFSRNSTLHGGNNKNQPNECLFARIKQ